MNPDKPADKKIAEKPHYYGHRTRLKEKLLHKPDALADYEILELILMQALPRVDVKPLAKQLIKQFGSLANVIAADAEQIKQLKGIGDTVVAAIKLNHIVSIKMTQSQIEHRHVINSWQELLDYCRVSMAYADLEQFSLIALNQRNHVIDQSLLQSGTINHVTLYPREIIKHALQKGATAVILVHNHPSGSAKPSKGDIAFTEKLHQALKPLDIALHDHIIITASEHYSFRQNGLLFGK